MTEKDAPIKIKKVWGLTWVLKDIVKGMTINEEIRLIKIFTVFMKNYDVSLEFLEQLFLAMDEANINPDAPENLLDLGDDFQSISYDIKYGRTTLEDFIKKIERVLTDIEK